MVFLKKSFNNKKTLINDSYCQIIIVLLFCHFVMTIRTKKNRIIWQQTT